MTTPLDIALEVIARGWNPVRVSRQTKKPIDSKWQERVFTAQTAPRHFNGAAINVGVQLGPHSHGLTDVDLDCPEAVAVASLLLPNTDATFGRLSKPRSHRLYVTGLSAQIDKASMAFHDIDSKKGKPGTMMLELRIGGVHKSGAKKGKCKGAQSVFPGSLHTSGEEIEWADNGDPANIGDKKLLNAVYRLAAAVLLARHWPIQGARHDAALIVGGFLARAGFSANGAATMVEAVAKAANDDEWTDRKNTARDAVSEYAKGGKVYGIPELIKAFGSDVVSKVCEWLNYKSPLQTQSASQPTAAIKPHKAQTGGYMTGKNDLVCNVGNVMYALDHEPELMNAFAYDEMLRTEILMRPIFGQDPKFKPRPVTDADVTGLQAWLQRFGFLKLGVGATHDAVNKHAREHSYHPLRDYLNALKWDGKDRLRMWLHTYLGAEHSEYSEEIGTMFLIGMVARALRPGCKLDYMLVLEGTQGTTRSTVCAILAGEYFSDHLPDISGKECSQHLRGKWLIEVAELRAHSRASIDQFKEFLTRTDERYRPAYGHREVHEPRQCCFVATTNKDNYLRDETGNRRFWPVKTGEINLDALRQDRDQLFAEAVNRFNAGAQWWPDPDFEQRCIADEQETRFEPDVWEPLIKRYLDCLHLPKRTSILHIAVNALEYETEAPAAPSVGPQTPRKTPINRFGIKEQGRVAAVLRHLKWVPKRKNTERWWEPGPAAK